MFVEDETTGRPCGLLPILKALLPLKSVLKECLPHVQLAQVSSRQPTEANEW